VPELLSFEEAATLPYTAVTAWVALTRHRRITAGDTAPSQDPLLLTGRRITLGSISVGSRADFEAMNRTIAMHRLHPVIDRIFRFADAKDAYRHFEGRGHFGKVVIAHG
jgi:NADPH:quinone reductase-like Zn-dependent oxidoreductase